MAFLKQMIAIALTYQVPEKAKQYQISDIKFSIRLSDN